MSAGSHTCLSAFDDEVRMTPLRRRASVTIALGEFVDGYDLIVISAALLQLQHHFHLGKGQVGDGLLPQRSLARPSGLSSLET